MGDAAVLNVIADETARTRKELKDQEDRRRWCVEQAIKCLPVREQIVPLAKEIENYLAGRWVT